MVRGVGDQTPYSTLAAVLSPIGTAPAVPTFHMDGRLPLRPQMGDNSIEDFLVGHDRSRLSGVSTYSTIVLHVPLASRTTWQTGFVFPARVPVGLTDGT